MSEIVIQTPKGERKIGPGNPVFIIAEMSGNHGQEYSKAIEIIDAAVDAGVDAIKIQTVSPDGLTIDCDNKYFQVNVNEAWAGHTLYNLYKKVTTPWEWQPKLKEYAENKGVLLFSTPVDPTGVDFLEKMNVVLYKVASFEMVDIRLLQKIGSTKKPVIISRGLGSVEDVELAIKTLKESGAPEVAVLHCISSYPAVPEQMNLATIPDIANRFGVVAGLSDHSLGITVPIAGAVLGASIIEKHFTIRRSDGGPDAAFSLEPKELKELVSAVRDVEVAVGKPTYTVGEKEAENMVFRRSLFVVKDMAPGEKFTDDNIRCIRPGYGLEPKFIDEIIGKSATCEIKRGTPVSWDLISKN